MRVYDRWWGAEQAPAIRAHAVTPLFGGNTLANRERELGVARQVLVEQLVEGLIPAALEAAMASAINQKGQSDN
ncbi:MAG: hypothetical protein KJ072_16425 [Verrucomicrobia bacterium]|nr:hypothetical protein [Verrucomicrobiota bacterium]